MFYFSRSTSSGITFLGFCLIVFNLSYLTSLLFSFSSSVFGYKLCSFAKVINFFLSQEKLNLGCVYFCKIFFGFGVNAFVANFSPTSTTALFPASKAFFAPSLATLLPTSRAEDAICLAALLVKILVKKFAMVSKLIFLNHRTHNFFKIRV